MKIFKAVLIVALIMVISAVSYAEEAKREAVITTLEGSARVNVLPLPRAD